MSCDEAPCRLSSSFGPECGNRIESPLHRYYTYSLLELYNVFSSETFRCKKRFSAKRLGSVTDYCKRLASKTKRFTHRAAAQHIISTALRAPRPGGAPRPYAARPRRARRGGPRGGRGGHAGCAGCSNFSTVRSMSSRACLELYSYDTYRAARARKLPRTRPLRAGPRPLRP